MARSTLDIADAVAKEIRSPALGTNWTQKNFECVSVLLPLWEMEQLATLRLSVIGTETDGERATRAHVKDSHRVLVGVQRTVSSKPDECREEVKAIVEFMFELKAYWLADGRRLIDIPTVYCKKAKVHVLYNPEALEEQSLYEGMVELNFEEIAAG